MDNNKFIENLKKILEENNISQKELANRIGTTEVSISRYMSGDRQPKIYIVEKIADVLGVSIDYLLGRNDMPNTINEPISIAASTKNSIDLSDICDEDKKTIMNIYNIIKNKNKEK